MRKQAIEEFLVVLRNRLEGAENSVVTIEDNPITKDTDIHDLLKAIPQAHANELMFVIDELQRIVEEN